jgi:uncharacterized YccA/Bax inhibitor family protein
MINLFSVLVFTAVLITAGVLFAGLFSMAKGGEFNRKYGNKLMRLRVICQGGALVLLVIALLIGRG